MSETHVSWIELRIGFDHFARWRPILSGEKRGRQSKAYGREPTTKEQNDGGLLAGVHLANLLTATAAASKRHPGVLTQVVSTDDVGPPVIPHDVLVAFAPPIVEPPPPSS